MQLLSKIKSILVNNSRMAILVTVILIVSVVFIIVSKPGTDTVVEKQSVPVVEVSTPVEYAGQESLSLIGNVRAFSEAKVTSERSGQVLSVNVKLGQYVSAGTVIASLENAAERAQVTQAEGAYESVLASASQSDVSVDQAKNSYEQAKDSAVTTYKNAYNTTSNVVFNNVDPFFSNPNGSTVAGLRISGLGNSLELNAERIAYQDLLSEWQLKTNSISSNSDLEAELGYASKNVQRTIDLVNTFIYIFNNQKSSNRYTDEELLGYSVTFTNLRSSLTAQLAEIDRSLTSLTTAKDSLRQAELGGTNTENSVSNAQIKQALGSLRAAEANLAKTILRTPISGTINSLSIRKGDYINPSQLVAVVANNKALEIVTSISDNERELLQVGDEVVIEDEYVGVVTQIAPAIDSVTKKFEVRIAAENENITNGDTVKISKLFSVEDVSSDVVRLPITAIKFEQENGFVFQVIDNKLTKLPVEFSSVLGKSVEITKGLSMSDSFVVDARGLTEGQVVEVAK